MIFLGTQHCLLQDGLAINNERCHDYHSNHCVQDIISEKVAMYFDI